MRRRRLRSIDPSIHPFIDPPSRQSPCYRDEGWKGRALEERKSIETYPNRKILIRWRKKLLSIEITVPSPENNATRTRSSECRRT